MHIRFVQIALNELQKLFEKFCRVLSVFRSSEKTFQQIQKEANRFVVFVEEGLR
jgi:hypothetical protein